MSSNYVKLWWIIFNLYYSSLFILDSQTLCNNLLSNSIYTIHHYDWLWNSFLSIHHYDWLWNYLFHSILLIIMILYHSIYFNLYSLKFIHHKMISWIIVRYFIVFYTINHRMISWFIVFYIIPIIIMIETNDIRLYS